MSQSNHGPERLFELLSKYSVALPFEVRRANGEEWRRCYKEHEKTLSLKRRLPEAIPDRMVALEADYLRESKRVADADESELQELLNLLNPARPDLAMKLFTALYRRDLFPLACADTVAGIYQQLLTAAEPPGDRRPATSAIPPVALAPAVKGMPGRRGYPREALEYAKTIRTQHPTMKASAIRRECLEKFSEDDLPPDAESFRRWMNRKRANRAN